MKTFTLSLLLFTAAGTGVYAQIPRIIAGADYSYDSVRQSLVPVPVDSTTYFYTGPEGGNAFSNIIYYSSSYYYLYDTGTGAYINSNLVQQTFDNNNNLVGIASQAWDTIHQTWVNFRQYQGLYDQNNDDTLDIFLQWNNTEGIWVPTSETHYTYTSELLVHTLWQNYNPATQQYVNATQDSTTHTDIYLVASDIYQNWDTARRQWFFTAGNNWYYSTTGLDTSFIELLYDTATSRWNNNFRLDEHYNPDSTEAFGILYYGNPWDTSQLDLFAYDDHKNQVLHQILGYAGNNTWDTTAETVTAYNSYNEGTFRQYSNYTNGAYIPAQASYYYYGIYTGLPELPEAQNTLRLYPNPSGSIVNVTATLPLMQPVQLFLYNTAGQQVWALDMGIAKSIQAQVPVNNLPVGVYTLTVQQNGYTENQKVVVAR